MASKLNPQDHPWTVNLALTGLVILHAIPSIPGWVPNIWLGLAAADTSVATSIYLGFLGAASIVAGFAGVVVIFGLSGESAKFRQFRLEGGPALAQNWTSTIASGFLAAGLALVAALFSIAGLPVVGPWFFELAVLIVTHGALRLIWLMRGLVRTVAADDVLKEKEASKKGVADAPWGKKKSA